MGWRDDWRDDCRAPTFTEYAVGKATLGDLYKHSAPPRTYADLYPSEYTPHPISHTEWADGYWMWREKIAANPEWFKDQCTEMKRRFFGAPCFADNEI
jgi:hypothetical protein